MPKEGENINYIMKNGIYVPRPQNSGYGEAGASRTKRGLKGFTAPSGSAVSDIDENNYTMRQRSRMLYMASPLATSAIRANRTNVIGLGLQLKSRINRDLLGMSQEAAEKWQNKTEDEFALWAERKRACDATGVNDFYSMQQLALISWLVSGDVFVLLKQYEPTMLTPYSLRLHIIEADKVSTPVSAKGLVNLPFLTTGKAANGNTICDGVEIDKNGMIEAYHVCNKYPFQVGSFGGSFGNIADGETKWTRVKAYGAETGLPNILQIMDSERPEQYRGVSYLAQVIEPLLQLRRYTESELSAALVESFFSAFIKTTAPTNENPLNETRRRADIDTESEENEYHMGPGQINIMKPGEDIEFSRPNRPASGFDKFTRAMSELVGAAVELPADLLLKSFNASYSASRASLLEAWKAFKMRREWFACDFCIPVYEAWMCEAVARGRITAPGFFTSPEVRAAYLQSDWVGPSQGSIDPLKEIKAEIMAINEGITTRENATININGGQWSSNVEQLTIENEKLRKARGKEGQENAKTETIN